MMASHPHPRRWPGLRVTIAIVGLAQAVAIIVAALLVSN